MLYVTHVSLWVRPLSASSILCVISKGIRSVLVINRSAGDNSFPVEQQRSDEHNKRNKAARGENVECAIVRWRLSLAAQSELGERLIPACETRAATVGSQRSPFDKYSEQAACYHKRNSNPMPGARCADEASETTAPRLEPLGADHPPCREPAINLGVGAGRIPRQRDHDGTRARRHQLASRTRGSEGVYGRVVPFAAREGGAISANEPTNVDIRDSRI